MPEPIYSIKLFYGDMKFTNDYSNVLQFNNKTARDNYFDSMNDTIEFENIEYNTILFDGGTVKLAIPNGNLDILDKFNYCYINFALVGNNGFVQNRKYYFILSYEIVSSNENITVVQFSLEYDIWQNNQFDFSIKESNIERMHVDRWTSDGKIKYTRPVLDAIESNSKVVGSISAEDTTTQRVLYQDDYYNYMPIIWVMVTAVHTFDRNVDQMLYHFIPVVYDEMYLTFSETNPANEAYYTQNAIKLGERNSLPIYFPSLQALDSAFLDYACGNGTNDDEVNVVNVQFFNWLPLKIVYENNFAVVKMLDDTPLQLYGGTPYFPGIVGNSFFATYAVGDLSEFSKLGDSLTKTYTSRGFYAPIKPTNGVDYSYEYEPALFMNPIMKRYITLGDVSASTEIPDMMYIKDMINNDSKLDFKARISFSATSAYTYFTINHLYTNGRVIDNDEGFALIKPSYLGDLISDAWKDYITTQRDSDRAMMWTNIATGGIAEAGSTVVSAGIGWRSNMERSRSAEFSSKFAKSQENYYNRAGNSPERAQFYSKLQRHQLNPSIEMFKGMGHNAMFMSGIGGVTAFSSNAIHQAMAQRQKERSIMNTPGTLAKSGNAIGSIIDKQFRFNLIETRVDDVSYEKYKMIFMKYGYYIGGVELPNINSRKFFNYIKTNGAVLTGSCNQLILSHLANIFDTGVTIWHMDYTTYATIYDYTKENIERSLM